MPNIYDISRFLAGQALGSTAVPSIDLTGKTIVVTGANTGLGFECVKHLVQMNVSKVILACRNAIKGDQARTRVLTEISNATASQLEVWEVDLASSQSVLSFVSRATSTLPRLDGFLANAGVEMTEFVTTEGLETTLAINVVATYLCVLAILPKLEETASKYKTQTTLSVVGSLIHTFGPDAQLDVPETTSIFEALSDPDTADMAQRYPLSKLMAHMCFHELTQRVSARAQVAGDGQVVINLVNPGWCASELGRHKTMNFAQNAIFAVIGRTAEQGSRTLVHAVTAGPETHGRYLSECQVKPESSFMQSERCRQLSARLWRDLTARVEQVSSDVAAIAA